METTDRLIVAADYDPREVGGIAGVEQKVMELAGHLQGLGVIIKVNSVLRALGYEHIRTLQHLGLKVFADLKLCDIPQTMEFDAAMLREYSPDFVTVMCSAGVDGMSRVQNVLGDRTKVLGVTVLSSLDEEECQAIFTCSTRAGVLRFARLAQLAKLSGLILAPVEAGMLTSKRELTLDFNTPNIRPDWSLVKEDDQNRERAMTPAKAIMAGVSRIVIGRPITQAEDPREAVERTLEEIRVAQAAVA